MIPIPRNRHALASLLAGIWVLCGCAIGSAPVVYYSLNPLPQVDPVVDLADSELGVGPVRLPDYLERLQLVTRTSANQLRVDDFRFWAAPLKDEIVRVLSADLKTLTHAKAVLRHPWSLDHRPDVAVEIQLHAFEGQPGGQVTLNAGAVFRDFRQPQPAPVRRSFTIVRNTHSADDEAMVATMNLALNELSRQIAGELEAMLGKE